MKRKSGILTTKIYRKENPTNRYLNYESCHSQHQKEGIIISLLNRSPKLWKTTTTQIGLRRNHLIDSNSTKLRNKKKAKTTKE